MKIVAIVQARMGSVRVPGKVMKLINNKTVIQILLERLSVSKLINEIVVATTENSEEEPLYKHVLDLGFYCEKGSEDNVLDRYYQAARKHKADIVVRITGDCPLIDSYIVDTCIKELLKSNYDYVTNSNPPTFPDGFDVEVMKFACLEDAVSNVNLDYEKEHVTPYIKNSKKFNKLNIKNDQDLSHIRLTLDEEPDYIVISNVFNFFSNDIFFSLNKVVDLYNEKPEIFSNNIDIKRNEGEYMGKGQKLWKRAKKIIPGGNMLLSKRSEMFLPNLWPSYFSKSKGCKVWDLDGNEFIDMSIMGIGTNILGYGNEQVDDAVRNTINNGNMSSLNCPEEVFLAEKLLDINPWADMVRFARSGGEANAIAIRIARAASGKDQVAICGYHGWHDWYLAANLNSSESLGEHLLPGLSPTGVPKNLEGTIFTFDYNNFKQLQNIVDTKNIGVVKMEVSRNVGPQDNFLEKVRNLCTSKGIVLIFDECTSGFRETFGGIHKKFNVEPDMAMYGKALGNGYAITATLGKKEIMEAAQSSFISSTFWTERIGPTAALKTLEVMKEIESWKTITDLGCYIKNSWRELSIKHNIKIQISGIEPLPVFTFNNSENNIHYKTYITQEMLKSGFLASNTVYVCIDHNKDLIDKYINELDILFKEISKYEDDFNRDPNNLLDNEICHSGFSRLN